MRRKGVDPRRWIAAVADDIWLHRLSDSAGGNVSLRMGDLVYMTPRCTGSRRRWHLSPKDVVVVDLHTREVLSRSHELSREAGMHFAIYEAFPEVRAVIHAHPFYSMVFASAGKPIPPTAEYTLGLGTIPLTEPAPAHSRALADTVVRTLSALKEKRPSYRMAVLVPAHGVVCVGKDLDEAYDVLERVETSARINLYSSLLYLKSHSE